MRLLKILIFLLLISGCAQTRMTAFLDPDFRSQSYRRLLIAPSYKHLDQRNYAECRFTRAFAETNTQALPSLQILLPTREYSDEEFFDLLHRHHIDAVLLIRVTEIYEELRYLPETYSAPTHGYLSAGLFARPRRLHTPEYYPPLPTGGYYLKSPRVRHEIILYDVASKRPAWIADALTAGDMYSQFKTLIKSLVESTLENLTRNGLIRKLDD